MNAINLPHATCLRRAIAASILGIMSLTIFAAPTQAGAEGGPIIKRDRVSAWSERQYTLRCEPDSWTTLAMAGDGDTDLDLFIYDAAGNLVASDIGLTDQAVLRWFSSGRQTFRVVVKNHGRVYNDFALASD